MEKKYKLTGETIEINGKTLHRIEALRNFVGVRKGDKGGFVESEENLSHLGNCWIYDNACVFEKAVVFNDAIVYSKARVCGNAQVFGKAVVASRAEVSGNAQVFEHAWLHGDAKVSGNAEVSGYAKVGGNAEINCIALDVELPVNVWHDASEIPKDGEWILIQYDDDRYDLLELGDTHADIFCAWCKRYGVIRWAYVSDLLPKGGKK